MKKVLFIVVPVLLVGSVATLGVLGIVPIPGLSPAKKKSNATALYTEQKEEPLVVKRKTQPEPPKPAEPNLEKGREELAKVWNELEPSVIVSIIEKWSDEDLARQLRYLEVDKTASVIALLKPDRASKVSKVLQVLGAERKAA